MSKTITYCLKSSPAVYSPGIIAWAINGYGFNEDRPMLLNIVSTGYPDVPKEHLHKLLSKEVGHTVDYPAETISFTVPT